MLPSDLMGWHKHVAQRPPELGTISFLFILGLGELVDRNPNADAYLMVQDDVAWPNAPDLAKYVAEFLSSCENDCIVSLYTCSEDVADQDGWRVLPDQWKYGALAFAFPTNLARRLTCDTSLRRYGWRWGEGVAGIDTAIGEWAQRSDIPIWHPTPSIVQHDGHVSAIWRASRAVSLRRASVWIGEA